MADPSLPCTSWLFEPNWGPASRRTQTLEALVRQRCMTWRTSGWPEHLETQELHRRVALVAEPEFHSLGIALILADCG